PAAARVEVDIQAERILAAVAAGLGARDVVLGGVLEDRAYLERREARVGLEDQRHAPRDARRRHAGARELLVLGAVGGGVAERRDDPGAGRHHAGLHLVDMVGVAVVVARALVREVGHLVVAPIERAAVRRGADRDRLVGRGGRGDALGGAVVAGGDAQHQTRVHRAVDQVLADTGRGAAAARAVGDRPDRHADHVNAVPDAARQEPRPQRVLVRDPPVEAALAAADTRAGIREHLAVHQPGTRSHAREIAARAAGAERGAGAVRGVVVRSLAAVVLGVAAAVHRR